MKVPKWRWSSISISARSQLKGTLALLLVGNVVFVIAQVSVLPYWGGSLGFKMVPCLGWVTPGTCRTGLCMHQVRSKREDVCLGLAL